MAINRDRWFEGSDWFGPIFPAGYRWTASCIADMFRAMAPRFSALSSESNSPQGFGLMVIVVAYLLANLLLWFIV
ncbi:MAG: hypothetical protein QGH07_15940, partial [Alphaproteobacteria bacterium]|nr:hypothetical protein [Alphaproteobacteria bacterium]